MLLSFLLLLFLESINARRQSVVTWSTVTSATGLPTLEPEPNRPRSSSHWKVKIHLMQKIATLCKTLNMNFSICTAKT